MGKKRATHKRRRHSPRMGAWMKTLTIECINELRQRLAEKGQLWKEWEYKLHGGNIIIYTPVTPWNPRTYKPNPKQRYLAKHLRIVPSLPGPYQLEYFRHTEQWWPLLPCTGDIKQIADFIEADEFGLCAPMEVPVSIAQDK